MTLFPPHLFPLPQGERRWEMGTKEKIIFFFYYLETTPITSISTRNSGFAREATWRKVLAGGSSTRSGAYFW
jgi:hypothetical protein